MILGDGTEPYQEIVRILLEAGANPNIGDGQGVIALAHALGSGYDEIRRILSEYSPT